MSDTEMNKVDENQPRNDTNDSILNGKRVHLLVYLQLNWFSSILIEIKQNSSLIERAVITTEIRITSRVLRTLTTLRKRLNDDVLKQSIHLLACWFKITIMIFYCFINRYLKL